MSASDQLLVVIDPVARRNDGESVRIAKDVLGARAPTKVSLPESPAEFARALARRGARRPVVVGDDRALLRAVSLLYRERELASCALSLVPVGTVLSLAHSLGVPTGAVAAARAVLEGVERRLDLLVDESDGVVLGDLRIPSPPPATAGGADARREYGVHAGLADASEADEAHGSSWLRHCQSLVRTLATRPGPVVPQRSRGRLVAPRGAATARLRVEADGVTLVDLDQPVDGVSVAPTTGGLARIEVYPASDGTDVAALRASARTVTVSGADFRYQADTLIAGPVRTRTWTARAGAWSLTLPAGAR